MSSIRQSKTDGNHAHAIVTPTEIRQPWISVYGFPVLAGRLACGKELLLVCRMDASQDVVGDLNVLLASPVSLRRAAEMLQRLVTQTASELAQLVAIELLPPTDIAGTELAQEVEEMLLRRRDDPDIFDRLATQIAPGAATQKIHGLARQMARVDAFSAALVLCETSGLCAEAVDGRCRTFMRNGQAHDHATLWQYCLRRRR